MIVEDVVIGKGKRKIELLLWFFEVNMGLDVDDVVEYVIVMVFVISVEDYGCVMDIGVKGFGGFFLKVEYDFGIMEDCF